MPSTIILLHELPHSVLQQACERFTLIFLYFMSEETEARIAYIQWEMLQGHAGNSTDVWAHS